MMQKNTEKRIAVFLILVFLIGLFPVMLIARYNYPCADDFGFSAYSHIAWEETHSLLQVLNGAVKTVRERWLGWQGTFSSIFVMALQPAVFGENAYSLVPWIMIGAMSLSTLFLLNVILRKVMLVRTHIYMCVSMIYLIFALECMIDKTQGFFWFNGAAHYMIPHSVAVVLCGLTILLLVESEYRFRRMFLACLAALFVGGSNYITGLMTAILFAAAFVAVIIMKKVRKVKFLFPPFMFFVVAFTVNICAPGNMVRQEEIVKRPGVVKSVLMSFYYCVEYVTEIWFDWTYIILILVLLPFIWEIVKTVRNKFDYRFPLLVPMASFCILSAMFTPSLYAMGEAGGGRIFNIIFLDYLFLIIINLYYTLGWIYMRFFSDSGKESCLETKEVKLYLMALLGMGLFIGSLYSKVNPDYFTSTSAVKSLITGEAAAYGEETRERTLLLRKGDRKEIRLPMFEVQPFLLYYSDIGKDADDWKNKSMGRYYQKEKIYGID